MKHRLKAIGDSVENAIDQLGLGMRAKLITIFLIVKVIPLLIMTAIAWWQISALGQELHDISVSDSSAALNDSAVENIERMTTDTAKRVASFLYDRDDDLRYLAGITPSEEDYRRFAEGALGRLTVQEKWVLAPDGASWVPAEPQPPAGEGGVSTNEENNDQDGFHYRHPDRFAVQSVPLYDEITFVDLNGIEQVKVTTASTKVNFPLDPARKDISRKENTYVKAETYFEQLQSLAPGEIFVSDVIGAYVGSNYIGMYTPDAVAGAGAQRGYDIEYDPQKQAYAGKENPNGQRFEGIVRWATPVTGPGGDIIGYVTFALNHDHIMEFVDHITPMNERYTDLPSAYDGNYAFIWDYQCRSICHPRHHSIVGFDPETGDAQVPWLENSIYEAWQASDVEQWTDFVRDWPTFDSQSRSKQPAPSLTRQGLVGLDGRYLNNAPQCTGWMDLTRDGGSGSFYILWSGLHKLTTAAAIPYYTGQYAPSEANDYSQRGFGFVAIGAGLEDFTRPSKEIGDKLSTTIEGNLAATLAKLLFTTAIIIVVVVLIAVWIASWLTGNITRLIDGVSRFRAGERQFRFHATVKNEFGTLADSLDDMADSIVDSVKNPLCITDMEQKIIYMNEAGLHFCGATLDEVVGSDYDCYSFYPADSNYNPITALETGREPDIYYMESRERYIKGTASYFLDHTGERLGYFVMSTDITDMVREQMQVEEQRTLLNEIFSASPDLIWYKNVKGEYLAVNPRFSAIAGKIPDECIGRTAEEILPPEIAGSLTENDRRGIESSSPLYTEERILFADGHEEILDSVRTPIYDANGTLAGLLGFARNVTVRVNMEGELRLIQLELESAVNSANEANRHKGEFLARMSHEIRTPMNAIIGITNILLGRLESDSGAIYTPEALGHIRQIQASSQHLLGLLNDILDISKIEAGKIELNEEAMNLCKLATTVAGMIKPRCEEKNITFTTVFDTFSPCTFLGDSLRLRQVLINLLGNSVKFTPECGTIEFRIERRDRKNGRTLVHFSVRDSGIGIPEGALETIFQPFEQGGNGVSAQFGGTGLGLAISRYIVQLFGGEIEVRSQVGEGSDFRFDIWLTETDQLLPEEEIFSDFSGKFTGKKVLLVDDVEINRIIVASMLEGTGVEIDEADDGLVAVQRFEQAEIGAYDLILMDVKMPNMDGYEASGTIRGLDRPDAKTVPIVALTANAFKDDIDRAIEHGMSAHIAKPVEMDKLLEVLFRFLVPKHSDLTV